jgi:glycosyltransferase involved in cell wall biosynthesis
MWHDLLESIPGLQDKTNGYTDYSVLVNYIHSEVQHCGPPDYIIRNATYFGPLIDDIPTISLLQDVCQGSMRDQQLRVCEKSKLVVFNTPYTRSLYPEIYQHRDNTVIPVGIDFDLFKPLPQREALQRKWGIKEGTVLFIGSTDPVKGFDLLWDIIALSSGFPQWCLVMKDGFTTPDPNVKVFNRVPHKDLVEIMNCCSALICTSAQETQHLAGIEAAACGLPLIVPPIGMYWDESFTSIRPFGMVVGDRNPRAFFQVVTDVLLTQGIVGEFSHQFFSPREHFLLSKCSVKSVMQAWQAAIDTITGVKS